MTSISNMRKILFTILFLSSISGYCQDSNNKDSRFPEYKWLNKKLPLDTLLSYQGDTLVLFNSNNHYVISFWHTNCLPCITEISWLNKLKIDYADENVEFIAISFDKKEEIDNLLASHPFNFELYYLNQKSINKNMLALGYPTNLVVSSSGFVQFQKMGGYSGNEKAGEIYEVLSREIKKLTN